MGSTFDSCGLHSLVWRARWEQAREQCWKDKLLTYNSEDCVALKKVVEFVQAIGETARSRGERAAGASADPAVAWADEIAAPSSRREWCRVKFAVQDFDLVNRCAWFNYQREKVYLRTSKAVREACRQYSRRSKRAKLRLTREVEIKSHTCPQCKGKRVTRLSAEIYSKFAYDLKFTPGGIRRQVIRCSAARHRCEDCNLLFLPKRYKRLDKYLRGLKSWAMYQHVVHRISFQHLEAMFEDCFGLRIGYSEFHMLKSLVARRYRPAYKRILDSIIAGGLIHADETQVKLQRGKGTVWALTNLEDVIYFYKPSREAGFLQELIMLRCHIILLLLLLAGCARQSSVPSADTDPAAEKTMSLAEARHGFRTKLVRREAAGEPLPTPPQRLFRPITFDAPCGELAAFLSPDPHDGKKHPAIIWITGGDCNTLDDGFWKQGSANGDQTASGFREAGIPMMFPTLRGGNENPGFREGFFGEVDDVLAAADHLAKQPFVDPHRIYLGGMSNGGTLVLLVAASSDRFRAVFAFGPTDDVAGYSPEYLPFDTSDPREFELRSPIRWLQAIRVPVFVFEGTVRGNLDSLRAMERASSNSKVRFHAVKGADHVGVLAPTVRLIAGKILRDDGPVTSIAFEEEELNRPFAE